MKWLQDNWTKVLLILIVILAAYFWWGDRQNRQKIKDLKHDIELRQDTILHLRIQIEVEKTKTKELLGLNDSLINVIDNKENEIKKIDSELKTVKDKLKTLTPTENVELLSNNLTKQIGKVVELEMRKDSTTFLDQEQIVGVNEVFVERDW